jgi:hypothetical protein
MLFLLHILGGYMESIEEFTDRILKEIIEEEKQKETKRQEIIKNGCPHTNKIKRVATISKIEFLECDICYKQFDLNGNEIKKTSIEVFFISLNFDPYIQKFNPQNTI